ncbi:MAG TPA: Rpn family recombination-promoting nuclease/putative transposase [Thermotogota bacterium]|nr:Rpn family recombination-promoting nuclease/putative transposase [Thermotogota bacterium]
MKEKSNINKHPHDAFFKGTFSKKEIAKDFLKNYLPPDVVTHINLDTLTNQKGEYIDKKLKKDFSDLLYQVEIDGHEGYVYILFEHKSYEDQKVIFQLLRYMCRIWEEKYNTKTKKVPVIIPIVIYHGKKVWNLETRLWKYILDIEHMPNSIRQMIPEFEYKAYDYSPDSKLEIRGRVILQAVLNILKAIKENGRRKLLDGFIEFVKLIENEADIQLANEIFELGLSYVMNAERDITEEELIRASLERGDVVQSLAQRLVNKGRQEGQLKEKNKIAVEMIREGLSLETIRRITKLPMEIIQELKKSVQN